MIRGELTKLPARSLKRFRIGISAFVLLVLAKSAYGWGSAGAVLAAIDHVRKMVSSEAGDAMDAIHAKFALSELVYRGTDRGNAILILALVFAGILAFNFWFAWHLLSVYARTAPAMMAACSSGPGDEPRRR